MSSACADIVEAGGVGTEPERTIMPKNSSASLRTKVRDYAAQHGLSYVAAHATLTGTADATPAADSAAGEDHDLYRIADSENFGWLTCGNGNFHGYDPTASCPRPLTDEQLAELAEQPGHPTLSIEQVAAIVELLPLGLRWVSTAQALAERLDDDAITAERVELIIDRIENTTTDRHGYQAKRFDLGRRLLEARPLAEIDKHFGPWRPVLPMTDQDEADLRAAFDLAGRKLIGSLASALEQLHHEARERFGPWDSDVSKTANYAQRSLTAGRPGSWEAELIMPIVWFGNELNLYPNKQSLSVEQRRQSGPSPRRVHKEARDQIAAVLRRWTAGPDRYTEVAETLAGFISSYADEKYGAEGWKKIADQWLQPGGMAVENFSACYRLLYSRSAHFDTDLI
ncbi:hypothetical protein [Amycolatopsis sp. cg9]|uniref:hypothetical protein n=1 Tax=Amycolatopsis sp. cg9 TaxID=3238801 RepID=UPI003524AA4B